MINFSLDIIFVLRSYVYMQTNSKFEINLLMKFGSEDMGYCIVDRRGMVYKTR